MYASIYAWQIKTSLDKWVHSVAEKMESPEYDAEVKDKLRVLADDYLKYKKKKDVLKIIPPANTISKTLSAILDNDPYAKVVAVSGVAAIDIDQLVILQGEYNRCVIKLNKQLDKRIPSLVGKLFRVRKLEELVFLM